jgi:FkbM family methyltransferase
MRKIFIDCGAHCGCTRRLVEETRPGFEIFSFEPDPELNQFCPDLINKAVWIDNGERTFYKFGIDGGSSLSLTRAELLRIRKPNYWARQDITVPCIDLDEFIKQFDKNDYIVLKLDIEGAEYDVIPHLIKNGSIKYINEFFIEWHDERVGVPVSENFRLTNELNGLGLSVNEWNAMNKHCMTENDPTRKKYHVR